MKSNEFLVEKEDADIEKVTAESYGQSASFDIGNVNPEFFQKENLRKLAKELCEELGFKLGPQYAWGEDKQLRHNYKNPRINGISVCQFLYSSSIVIHGIDELHKVFLDIFTCESFDEGKAQKFIEENIPGEIKNIHSFRRK